MLEQFPDADLHVYVVWLPVLSRMTPEALHGAARSSAKRLAEAHVQHYLDAEVLLGARYGRTIHLPGKEPAWDVYFAFGRTARWEAEPPVPDYWMHQLGDAPPQLRFRGEKFAAVVAELLATAAEEATLGAADEASPPPSPLP